MDFHMLFQVAGPRTFIITFCTRIRFFSCMCSNMLCQSTLLNKYLVAIWFRAIVGWSPGQLLFMDTPHMKQHVWIALECVATDLAFKSPGFAVRELMFFQSGSGVEAHPTSCATESSLFFMRWCNVHFQFDLVKIFPSTLSTHEVLVFIVTQLVLF